MWMNGSRSGRLTPANARRTGKPSPSKPDGAVVILTTGRSPSAAGSVTRGRTSRFSTVTAGMWRPQREVGSGFLSLPAHRRQQYMKRQLFLTDAVVVQREARLQEFQRLVDALHRGRAEEGTHVVLGDGDVLRQEYRHHHAHDRAGQHADPQAVRGALGPPSQARRDRVDRAGELA